MATIGFVIHPKSEDDVFQFVKINSRLIGKIVITKTDKGKIETLFDKKDIVQVPSLVEKGDAAMAAKVSKGEVQAVFFIHPHPENASGIIELIGVCAKRKINLAFTVDTADCILGRIGTGTSSHLAHQLSFCPDLVNEPNSRLHLEFFLSFPRFFTPHRLCYFLCIVFFC
jgi:methylglyoxal synthase